VGDAVTVFEAEGGGAKNMTFATTPMFSTLSSL